MDTDSNRLPDEAYAVELRRLDARVWCCLTACKSPIGGPGYTGGGEADLCEACEQARLCELTPDELAMVPV